MKIGKLKTYKSSFQIKKDDNLRKDKSNLLDSKDVSRSNSLMMPNNYTLGNETTALPHLIWSTTFEYDTKDSIQGGKGSKLGFDITGTFEIPRGERRSNLVF